MGLTTAREGLALGIYFAFFEKIREHFSNTNENLVAVLGGGFVGVCSWFFTYPIDILKTKIQLNYSTNTIKEVRKFTNIRSCFKGVVTCCARAFPVNAI